MAMTTAGKVALALTIIITIIGMCLTIFHPNPTFAAPFRIFEAACVLAVGAMGLGGIGCKNRCLMMTFIVFAIIGIAVYTLILITSIANVAQAGDDNKEWLQEQKEDAMTKVIAWLVGLFINQILTAVAVFFYFKARREITEQMYNEFYNQNPVGTPVAYSPYPQYGYPAPAYPGQAYPAPYYYQ